MIYGYARCSLNEKKQDVKRQKRELKAMGAQHIFSEYESGTKIHREELDKLLAVMRPGDTIVVTEVSRITRSTKQLCDLLEKAEKNSWCLKIGMKEIDCTDGIESTDDAMLKIMAVFAELERANIAERTRSGMANVKAKGKHIGRPYKTVDKLPKVFLDHFPDYIDGNIRKKEYARLCGIARSTLDRYIAILTDR